MRRLGLMAGCALLLASCGPGERAPRIELGVVTDKTFEQEVLASKETVLVDFGAVWCPPCHAATPILEEIGAEFAGKARVVKVDVDDSPETSGRYDVETLPTFIIFKDGREHSRRSGLPASDAKLRLSRWLSEALE